MTEDWAAVASAINQRMAQLGVSQREVIMRSQLSKAVVREIQHNVVQRRRSDRTLEALSVALDWHPGHLAAVLAQRRPPEVGEPVVRPDDDVPGRLAVIEHQLRQINDRLARIDAFGDRLNEINANVATVAENVAAVRKERDR
ncbi:transcriptional regulator [Amycolatopsis aidingensis]|uniref:transcriptional regulator n=1 Tax=Amycolatopsis aidingensis TaxID=2842453 RepID=UPI001C0CBDBE|nr:transcriptional regulator [Amycolatopsis aidingensis]